MEVRCRRAAELTIRVAGTHRRAARAATAVCFVQCRGESKGRPAPGRVELFERAVEDGLVAGPVPKSPGAASAVTSTEHRQRWWRAG